MPLLRLNALNGNYPQSYSYMGTLMKNGFIGQGKFILYKYDLEDCTHLFLNFPFVYVVWEDVSLLLGVNVTKDVSSIATCIMYWAHHVISFRAVPLYILWGIWRAINDLK